MQKVDFDNFTDNYEEILLKEVKFFGKKSDYFVEYQIELIKRYADVNPKTVFEFGCGIGRNIKFIKKYFEGVQIFGSDVSKKSLEHTKKEHPYINFICFSEGEIKNRFDLIIIIGVLHHINPKERELYMKQISNLLTPEGELFVFEHNPFNPVTQKIVNNCVFDDDAVLLKPCELKSLFEKSGLRVEKFGYVLFIPEYLKKIRFIEKYFMWLPLGGKYFFRAKKCNIE